MKDVIYLLCNFKSTRNYEQYIECWFNNFIVNSKTNLEYHSKTLYSNSAFLNNDEISISMQNEEMYALPSLYIEGKLLTSKDEYNPTLQFSNDVIALLFEKFVMK